VRSYKIKLVPFLLGMLGISIVIGIHEFGHWSMCHLFGVATPNVSIGIGPALFDFSLGKTQVSVGIFPLGGYVEMLGPRQAIPGFEQASFASKPLGQKVLILLGGIIFNVLSGLLTVLFIKRRRRKRLETAQPEDGSDPGETLTGANGAERRQGIIGPLGIISLLMRSSEQGREFYLFLLGVLSINLGIFNLLPLPLLDGGQLVLTLYESLTGSALSDLTYDTLSLITIIIVVAVAIYATGRDLWALRRTKK
jgi:regulator of sigma E protease